MFGPEAGGVAGWLDELIAEEDLLTAAAQANACLALDAKVPPRKQAAHREATMPAIEVATEADDVEFRDIIDRAPENPQRLPGGRPSNHSPASECAIHLQDAEAVLGEPVAFTRERAAASINETLRLMWRGGLLMGGDLDAQEIPDAPIEIRVTDLDWAWPVTKAAHDVRVQTVDLQEPPGPVWVAGSSGQLSSWLLVGVARTGSTPSATRP